LFNLTGLALGIANNYSASANGKTSYQKNLLGAIVLFSSNLAWFFIFHFYLLGAIFQSSGNSMLPADPAVPMFLSLGQLVFYGSAVISGLFGSLIAEKTDRRRFLFGWLIFGTICSFLPAFLTGFIFNIVESLLLGFAFGLGFPACQALLTEAADTDSRGKMASFAFFITLIVVIVSLLIPAEVSLAGLIGISVSLKVIGIVALLAVSTIGWENGIVKGWFAIIRSSDFYSYAIPWLIFNIANGFLFFGVLSTEVQEFSSLGIAIELLFTVFSVMAAGVVADRYGRKLPVIVGLVLLGVGYGFFGIVSNAFSYLIYLMFEGIAWGLIVVCYMQVILGDLSAKWGSKERFFAIGGIAIAFLTRSLFGAAQQWTGLSIPANTLSSVLSIVVILSIIPVWRAPETLPESKIREKQLKRHMDKIGKIIKESKKNKK
jgi:MFS family permease